MTNNNFHHDPHHNLHIHTLGEGSPLVMLHGLGSSSEDWEYNREALANNHQLIMVDLPGHGRTPLPTTPLSIPSIAGEILRVLSERGLHEFDLLGLSLGGAVAFEMAAQQPGRVRSLVIVNAAPTFRLSNPSLLWQYILRSVLLRCLGMDAIARLVAKKLFPEVHQEELRTFAFGQLRKADKRAYRKMMTALTRWSVLPRIAAIHCPVLFLASEHDALVAPWVERIKGLLANVTVTVVPGARHGLMIEQPEAFNAAVLDFIGQECSLDGAQRNPG